MAEADPIGYAAALAELEAILAELEDDEVDVDVLAARITRARELIEVCRHRIENARIEVERVQAAEDS
jgi:exodeoxyribonuclease VII small subunit